MSKRAGEFVTLDELVERDRQSTRRSWYLLARSHDTTVDLDLDLAREQSAENPVYYVQYAHARIASIIAKAGPARVTEALADGGAPAGGPLHPSERALIEQLLAFPGELAEASERRAPHRLAAYVLELAQGFTAFYRDCHVLGAEPRELESLRLALVGGHPGDDRPLPGPAGRERPAADVTAERRQRAEALEAAGPGQLASAAGRR